jgi:hypothetical protein
MTWFKVDDRFHGHPKAIRVSLASRGLWVVAGSWCAAQLTDGFVPSKMVVALGGRKRDAEALIECGLWVAAEGGYQFHDWLKYQPSAAEMIAKRESEADRKRQSRAKTPPESRQNPAKTPPSHGQDFGEHNSIISNHLAPVVRADKLRSPHPPTRPDQIREEAAASSPGTAAPTALDTQLRGFNFVAGLLGRSQFDIPPLGSFAAEYGHIGSKPEAERLRVAKAVNADVWCRENPSRVDAPHLQRSWQKYLAGPVKQIARAVQQPAAAPTPLAHQIMKF